MHEAASWGGVWVDFVPAVVLQVAVLLQVPLGLFLQGLLL